MINGVLVEQTVNDVMPQLQSNADGLKKILDDLVKQYKKTQDEMEKWKVCHDAWPPDAAKELATTLQGLRMTCRTQTMYRSCNSELHERI